MVFKKGNTYELKAQIKNIDVEEITKTVFKFNNIKKTYIANGESEGVTYQGENIFIISLSQAETLSLSNDVPCFYDSVTRRTFYNAGTGTFLYEEL